MGRAKLCLYDRELQRMLPAQVAPPLQPRCISRLGRLPSDMVQIDTSKWGEEFRRRPSWVDAGMALRLIQSDKAKGNKPALWIRMLLQRGMLCLGHRIQRHAGQVLFFGLLMLSICCIGLRLVAFETDMEKLWIESTLLFYIFQSMTSLVRLDIFFPSSLCLLRLTLVGMLFPSSAADPRP
ncbi:protein patched protein [Trichinella spiralis]|uniref:protein patched protein n=1 Tax=Trichinella spiralis TaxID=6334 RepID=UPI0001EFE356|nr:protein patched protein [Trichinella spiralis]